VVSGFQPVADRSQDTMQTVVSFKAETTLLKTLPVKNRLAFPDL
jgi:hypothetical protein